MLHIKREPNTSRMVTVVMREIVITPTTLLGQRREKLLTTKGEMGRVTQKGHPYTLVIKRETKERTHLERGLEAQCSIAWERMAHKRT